MDLKKEFGLILSFLQCTIHAYHGFFHDLCSSTLDHSVYSSPLCCSLLCFVPAVYSRYFTHVAPICGDIALFFGTLHRRLHKLSDSAVTLEILVYELLGLASGNTQFIGESEGAHAIHNAEVDGFGHSSLMGIHFLHGFFIYQGGSVFMYVFTGKEGFHQTRVLGHPREHHQLDLGVVRTDEDIPFSRDKGVSDQTAFIRPYRNILEVGVSGGKTTCSSSCLQERSMYPAVPVGQRRKNIDICALQL